MPNNTTTRLEKRHLILCEGQDAFYFLIHYLNSPALSDIPGFSNDIQVMDFGGNADLFSYLKLLQLTPDFDTVTSLCIIRDAESDANAAVREVKSALGKANFPIPDEPCSWTGESFKVGFVLFPTCNRISQNGTLEDLCLSSLSEQQPENILAEIDSFLQKLQQKQNREFPRIFKNRLHTYLSTHNDYVSLKIGEAAKANAFNWNSAALTSLRNFLSEVL